MLDYAHSITQADQKVQVLLSGFIEKTYTFISSSFRTPLLFCLLIYILLVGYGVISGWFQLIWKEFFLILAKIVFVTSLMFDWPFFQDILVNIFTVGAADMVHVLTSHVLYHSSAVSQGTTESLSQGLMVEVASVGLWVWKMASFSSPLPIFFGLVLWVCGIGVILYGVMQILISKIMITLLLASAPFILVFSFFGWTSQVVWSWLRLLLSNLISLFLVSISLNLSFYLLHEMFDDLYKSHGQGIVILQLIPIVLLSILSFSMIKRCVSAAFQMGLQASSGSSSGSLRVGPGSSAIRTGVQLLR